MVLAMTFVIISGEIDLSVASMMGLSAALVAVLCARPACPWRWRSWRPCWRGVLVGLFNGFFVAVVGLPSLAVTLAGYIGFRGLACMLVEDRSIGRRVPRLVQRPRPAATVWSGR